MFKNVEEPESGNIYEDFGSGGLLLKRNFLCDF
jgi:hypothetical protein